MWVHPMSIKRPEFGILSHLYTMQPEEEDKVNGVLRMNVQQF
jgi:hypothetical protein